jgi:hypothetical protein
MQWQQALQLVGKQQAAGLSSCSRQGGAAAAAWYGHAARRLMSTVATDAAAAARASGATVAAAGAAASQVRGVVPARQIGAAAVVGWTAAQPQQVCMVPCSTAVMSGLVVCCSIASTCVG